VKFLVSKGAKVTVTDLKLAPTLKSSVIEIRKFLKNKKNIHPVKFVLGKHRLEDFRKAEMIFKAAGVPLDSIYIAEAKKNGVPIFMDDALFALLAPCQIIGITGTRGKTTTSTLIAEVVKATRKKVYPHTNKETGINFFADEAGKNNIVGDKSHKTGIGVGVYLAGNIKGMATLPLLDKVKKDDIVVLELSSWQLQGWRDLKISPHVAVVTNIYSDHQNYYKNSMAKYVHDKEAIFANQNKNDFLALNKNCVWCKKMAKRAPGKVVWFSASDIPRGWKLKILGEHNLENIAAAVSVGKLLNIPLNKIKKVVENFRGVPGRLEFVREVRGVKYYNDTTATMPEATIAALRAIGGNKIILICGGADKNLNFKNLALVIKKHVKAVVMLNGTATPQLRKELQVTGYKSQVTTVNSMREAVKKARKFAVRDDAVLLSPAAASFGMFKNEFDRGEQFLKEVKKIK
jgi:UDP-N-acetylmuramoylalanine--D-glutamate ligase